MDHEIYLIGGELPDRLKVQIAEAKRINETEGKHGVIF